ncbi:MAG: protein translocase subunit SecF, partial [Planctomycetaceae bacterium]|nr:protein translocase subunit SecF [Planctomycetaceae bacterium]
RGFAVTLFIGIVMSMFTALYLGRLMFDIAEKKRWVKSLSMMSLVGNTSIDFLGKRSLCAGLSALLIVGGMTAFVARGNRNLDIDFTGGTMVSFQLTEAHKTEDVQKLLADEFKENGTIERLSIGDDNVEGIGRHFRLRTTEGTDTDEMSAQQQVRERVQKAFSAQDTMQLRRVSMTFDNLSQIEIAESDMSAEARVRRRFNGAATADVELSDEVAAGTLSDQLAAAVATVQGLSTDADLSAMFEVEGTAGSGMDAGLRSVRKFSKVTVRTVPEISVDQLQTALTAMQKQMDTSPLFDEVNSFASAVATQMQVRAIMAILISMLVITGYIWFRFQSVTFGLAAVAALVHDVLIVLGMVAVVSSLNGTAIGNVLLLADFKINLSMVAAFLTIVGYSLNDTIVVFDRIRETRGKNPTVTTPMVNESLNQTLSRTLLTSLTTFLVVVILYFLGGEGIHGFAFCLTVGILVGTYSSIYVASPILVWLMNRENSGRSGAAS